MNKCIILGLFVCVALAFDPEFILKRGASQMRKTAEYIGVDNKFPTNTRNGDVAEDYVHYLTASASDWVSGFFSAELWLMYDYTKDDEYKQLAIKYTEKLASQANNTGTHDLGFMVGYSFIPAYKFTGEERYKDIVFQASKSLASRYSEIVGCIRSWGSKTSNNFQVIVDNLMNLDMLLWSTKEGSTDYRDLCIHHLNNTITHFVREDYTHYHEVDFDATTGKMTRKLNPQGKAPETTWARGQAWGVYGFNQAYQWTGDERYLKYAIEMGEWFMAHLPEDNIPYWDFDALVTDPRDSSSSAIVASAYLDIYEETHDKKYFDYAIKLLDALSTPEYLADPETHDNLLNHGTPNYPGKTYDTGIIYGDFYFLEAAKKIIDRHYL